MQKILIPSIVFLFLAFNTAKASNFKLDPVQLEQKFLNAVEVSVTDFSAPLDNEVRLVDKNVLVLSAVFCGTLGLHRKLLGHNASAKGHLKRTGISLATIIAGVIFFTYSSFVNSYRDQSNLAEVGILLAFLGTVYLVTHQLFVVVEGFIYLVTPQERFDAKNGLRYDRRYFAAFKSHHIPDTN